MQLEELKKLAELARIEVDTEELSGLQKDMESVLEYVSRVKEIGESAFHVDEGRVPRNVMRDDSGQHESGIYTEELLSLAPQREKNYVKVKKIL